MAWRGDINARSWYRDDMTDPEGRSQASCDSEIIAKPLGFGSDQGEANSQMRASPSAAEQMRGADDVKIAVLR